MGAAGGEGAELLYGGSGSEGGGGGGSNLMPKVLAQVLL